MRLRIKHLAWVFIIICVYMIICHMRREKQAQLEDDMDVQLTKFNELYKTRLMSIASEDKEVILSLVDKSYIDMALNFYEISIKTNGIKNLLLVSLSQTTCDVIIEHGIACFAYSEVDPSENTDAVYGSSLFKHKMNVRASFVVDALKWGFKVLLTDLDIVFFKNPLPYFECNDCDIECLVDKMETNLNAGFLYMRPTPMAIRAYKLRIKLGEKNPKLTDQNLFNKALTMLETHIRVRKLPTDLFVYGEKYFEDGQRHFLDGNKKCENCVVMHNNWIVSKEAKIYRFRESHMWLLDKDRYYTSKRRKYLVYDNPKIFQCSYFCSTFWPFSDNANYEHEVNALINALAIGQILDRIVILPKFHDNKGREVSLLNVIYLTPFEKKFGGRFREHAFVTHPKVPERVRQELARRHVFSVTSTRSDYADIEQDMSVRVWTPSNPYRGATEAEIRKRFRNFNDRPVLHFHNLYGAFSHFSHADDDRHFRQRVHAGIVRAPFYKQYTSLTTNLLNILHQISKC